MFEFSEQHETPPQPMEILQGLRVTTGFNGRSIAANRAGRLTFWQGARVLLKRGAVTGFWLVVVAAVIGIFTVLVENETAVQQWTERLAFVVCAVVGILALRHFWVALWEVLRSDVQMARGVLRANRDMEPIAGLEFNGTRYYLVIHEPETLQPLTPWLRVARRIYRMVTPKPPELYTVYFLAGAKVLLSAAMEAPEIFPDVETNSDV